MSVFLVTNGQARVSTEDFEWAQGITWHRSESGYIKTRGPRSPLRMHRLVMTRMLGRELTADEFVDHINGNKSDNRRENLRIATKSENGMNRGKPRKGNTSFAGVHFDASRLKYMAYINVRGQRFYLGRFSSENEAAWMYDQWAIELHGDFARLNLEYV